MLLTMPIDGGLLWWRYPISSSTVGVGGGAIGIGSIIA